MIVICIFIFFFILFVFTSIEIEIEGFKYYSTTKEANNMVSIWLRLRFLNKITYFKYRINNKKINRNKLSKRINKIQSNFFKKRNSIFFKKNKKIKIKSRKIDLNLEIGTEDAATTAIIIGFLSPIICYLISLVATKKEETKWKMMPIYDNKNILKIDLNCIFSINLTHIMSII